MASRYLQSSKYNYDSSNANVEFIFCASRFPVTLYAFHLIFPKTAWGVGTIPVEQRTVYKESALTCQPQMVEASLNAHKNQSPHSQMLSLWVCNLSRNSAVLRFPSCCLYWNFSPVFSHFYFTSAALGVTLISDRIERCCQRWIPEFISSFR